MRIQSKTITSPVTNIVYIYFITGIFLFFIAILWWFWDLALSAIYASQQANFPTAMNDAGVVFLMNIWHYFPTIAFFGLGVWAMVKAHKDKARQG